MSIDPVTGKCSLCGDRHTPLSQVMQVNVEAERNCTFKWIARELERIANALESGVRPI